MSAEVINLLRMQIRRGRMVSDPGLLQTWTKALNYIDDLALDPLKLNGDMALKLKFDAAAAYQGYLIQCEVNGSEPNAVFAQVQKTISERLADIFVESEMSAYDDAIPPEWEAYLLDKS